jgi:hypothetical protein
MLVVVLEEALSLGQPPDFHSMLSQKIPEAVSAFSSSAWALALSHRVENALEDLPKWHPDPPQSAFRLTQRQHTQ